MKLLYALLVVLAAGVCSAQQGTTVQIVSCGKENDCVRIDPAPLKCGKWEHVQQSPLGNSHISPDGMYVIFETGPDICVPDLHTVTEKEWQELMERLKRLEHPPVSTTLPWPFQLAPARRCDDYPRKDREGLS